MQAMLIISIFAYLGRMNYTKAIDFLEPIINKCFYWLKHNSFLVDLGKVH